MFMRFLFGLALFGQFLSAQENSETLYLHFDQKGSTVMVPAAHFKLAYDGSQPGFPFMEFIPEEEEIDHWTEILTLQGFGPSDPTQFLEEVAAQLPEKAPVTSYMEGIFNVAFLMAEYPAVDTQAGLVQENLNEALFALVVGHPNGTWSIQFCKRYRTDLDEREAALQRLQNFVAGCGIQPPSD